MSAHCLEPGAVLADRYVVEELLAEDGAATSWRARDRVLARSVVLQVISSSAPGAAAMLAAAKQAACIIDPRILQVLDAIDDGDLSYVVREWASGQSLDALLVGGPLPPRRAAWLAHEVAEAICRAHAAGLPHGGIAPDTVLLTRSSGVKIVGLGSAWSRQPPAPAEPGGPALAPDARAADVRDIGRILYASLTARWPGGAFNGLPAAPTEHGRLLRPRQVRAGVPRMLDALCDRILGDQPRSGPPLSTAEEVRAALSEIMASEDAGEQRRLGLAAAPMTGPPDPAPPPPALIAKPSPAGREPSYDEGSAPAEPRRNPLGRTLLWAAVGVLIAGGVLLAYLIAQHGLNPPPTAHAGSPTAASTGDGPSSSGTGGTPQPVAISGVHVFDPPPGDGVENNAQAKLAIDNSTASAWPTSTYRGNPKLGGLKSGVGLVVDLGRPVDVRAVTVRLQGRPTSLQLRAAPPEATAPPMSSASDYVLVASRADAGTTVDFSLDQPVRTRFLLVWLTSLPPVHGGYRGAIADITVTG
ncbi:MAG TPA: protein kinase family protein [Nocardioidaceae bacterium]|nr:protein kinase family protein [Nocardioidaceae bacterium]